MNDIMACQQCSNCVFFKLKSEGVGVCSNNETIVSKLQGPIKSTDWCMSWGGEIPVLLQTHQKSQQTR